MIFSNEIDPYFKLNCEKNNLDKKIVYGIIKIESQGNPFALRYELKDKDLVTPEKFARMNNTTVITEFEGQRFSFGLMQILASTARGIGFNGPLGMLFNIQTNLYYGCKYLGDLKKRFPDGYDYIAAFNAGHPSKLPDGSYTNQSYVDTVLKFIESFKDG